MPLIVCDVLLFPLERTNSTLKRMLFKGVASRDKASSLLANDNADANTDAPLLTNLSTDGSNAVLDLPGVYAVAVAGAGRNPVSNSGLIFDFASPTEISGADGPGGLLRHTGWVGEGAVGAYAIDLQGVDFAKIPSPAGFVMLGAGVLACRARRR